MLLADVSSNTLYAAQKVSSPGVAGGTKSDSHPAQVNLETKCGLKRFRAARSAPQTAPGAAASAAASTGAGQPSPAPATPAKVRVRRFVMRARLALTLWAFRARSRRLATL